MHIVQIQAENIKKLKVVRITANGEHVRVAGIPGLGKTTLIDLVWAALEKKGLGASPVTRGKDDGYIEVQLGGDGSRIITVRRDYSAESSVADKLKIKTNDGSKIGIKDIQTMLESISFDPLAFYSMKGKEQVDLSLQLAGVDVSALDSEYQSLYFKRMEIAREVDRLKARCTVIPEKVDPVNVSELSEELIRAQEKKAERDEMIREMIECGKEMNDIFPKIEELKAKIKELERLETEKNLRLNSLAEKLETMPAIDIDPIMEKMRGAQETNAAASKWIEYSNSRAELDKKTEEYNAAREAVADVEARKRAALDSAKWPVEGLSVEDGCLTLKGIPLDQCGESERLRVSFALAAARQPELKICRIDGAESLGAEGRRELIAIAERYDMQVFMARVADGGAEEGEITIEDGVAVKTIKGGK